MKNFALAFILVFAVTAIAQMFFPWWIVAVVAFAAGMFIKQNPLAAFCAGFFGVFTLWILYAYVISAANNHLLAGKVAELMKALTAGKASVLFLITGVLGGLVGGLACLTGSLTSKLRG